jgi:hypothetical protein
MSNITPTFSVPYSPHYNSVPRFVSAPQLGTSSSCPASVQKVPSLKEAVQLAASEPPDVKDASPVSLVRHRTCQCVNDLQAMQNNVECLALVLYRPPEHQPLDSACAAPYQEDECLMQSPSLSNSVSEVSAVGTDSEFGAEELNSETHGAASVLSGPGEPSVPSLPMRPCEFHW